MKPLIVILLLSFTLSATEEIHTITQSATGDSERTACQNALNYAKQDALERVGVIVQSSLSMNEVEKNQKMDTLFMNDFQQFSKGIVKVLNKKELSTYSKSDKVYLCNVTAKLSVNIEKGLEKNKRYEGQLPDWVVTPPKIQNRIVTIADATSAQGALTTAIMKYVMITKGVELNKVKMDFYNLVKKGDLPLTKLVFRWDVTQRVLFKGIFSLFVDDDKRVDSRLLSSIICENGKIYKQYYYLKMMKNNYLLEEKNKTSEKTTQGECWDFDKYGFKFENEKIGNGKNARYYTMLIAPKQQDYLKKASDSGELWATTALGKLYINGIDGYKDYKKAQKILLKASKQGEKRAMKYLADIYLKGGYGVKKNPQEAIKWLKKWSANAPYTKRIIKQFK